MDQISHPPTPGYERIFQERTGGMRPHSVLKRWALGVASIPDFDATQPGKVPLATSLVRQLVDVVKFRENLFLNNLRVFPHILHPKLG